MYLKNLLAQPTVLVERGKVSHELINNAAQAGMTFGCETEFYVKGVGDLLKKYLTQNAKHDGNGNLFKPVEKLTWDDVLLYFEPIGMGKNEIISDLENQDLTLRRLTFVYRKLTKNEKPEKPAEMFQAVLDHFGPGQSIMILGIFPAQGFMVKNQIDNETAKSRIEEFRRSPSNSYMEYAKKFDALNFTMSGTFGRTVDDFMFSPETPQRHILLKMLAEIISKAVGEEVVVGTDPDKNPETSEGYTKWLLTVDSSLKQDDDKDIIGIELVSPITDINTGFKHVQTIFHMIKAFGQYAGNPKLSAFTDEHTGFHVNLGLGKRPIDATKLLFLLDDDYILNKFDRFTYENGKKRENHHARNSFQTMLASIRSNPTNMQAIIDTVDTAFPLSTKDIEHVLSKLKSGVEINKTMTVNLSKLATDHFVEFRAMGNKDYENRLEEILRTIRTFATMMYAASDPQVYRKEYLSKVFRVVKGMSGHYKGPLTNPMSGDKDVIALMKKLKASPLTKLFQRGDRTVARMYGDLKDFFERYEKTGKINSFAFKQSSNNLLTAIRSAVSKGTFELTPQVQQTLRAYLGDLRTIVSLLKGDRPVIAA